MVFGGLVGCRERVREVELLGESGKSRIRGPEAVSTDDSRGQQVDINPSGPLTMQTALPSGGAHGAAHRYLDLPSGLSLHR